MEASKVLELVIFPALELLPPKLTSEPALVQVLANGYQESKLKERYQLGGPARGLWQFELGGGVKGVMWHPSTHDMAQIVCSARQVAFDQQTIYHRLAEDDILAAAFARLLIYADPQPLPAVNDEKGSWECYLRTWRPGKPRPDDWPESHKVAVETLG